MNINSDSLATIFLSQWYPPKFSNWILIQTFFAIAYPVMGTLQFVVSWYGMGKTSVKSVFNIPGRIAWFTMEIPGFITLLYTMMTLSQRLDIEEIPWQNKVLAALFTLHYIYRAIVFPFLQPSMSPIHLLIWLNAVLFQVCNGLSIGAWLGGFGPLTAADWSPHPWSILQFTVGIAIFYVGLMGNFYHDEELREIRRTEKKRREMISKGMAAAGQTKSAISVEKHYRVPQAMLFKWLLYPHYLCEWIEWFGFWMAAGWSCAPARIFLVNEIFAMFPRAYNGRKWYIDMFGEDKIRKKWTIIPGLC